MMLFPFIRQDKGVKINKGHLTFLWLHSFFLKSDFLDTVAEHNSFDKYHYLNLSSPYCGIQNADL